MPVPRAKQLTLSTTDRADLKRTIRDDWTLDSRDNTKLNKRRQRNYQLWRGATELHAAPEQERSNFHIPLTQWQCSFKLAKEVDALLGDDAEVSVRPRGPQDAERVPKVRRYMNWRVKTSLKLFKKLYDYLLTKIVQGTAIGLIQWKRKTRVVRSFVPETRTITRDVIDPSTGLPATVQEEVTEQVEVEKTVVDFEGPEFIVENIEDWAVPVAAKDLEDAEHFSRRLRLTVDEMLAMADEDKLDTKVLSGTKLEKLRQFAETGRISEETETESGKLVRDEKKTQRGLPIGEENPDRKVTVINWFGRYRRPSAKAKDRAEEIVAFYQPEMDLLLGASRLVDLFPDGRRPFVKSELIRDGRTFWGIGLPEWLASINDEMDVQHNALTDASVFAVGPVIVHEPAAGFNPESFRYEAFQAISVANADKVKAINLANINMAPFITLQPQLLGYAERVTGLTEAELGRPFAQPNAPRTLGQQQILQRGSGVRLVLDLRLERENLRELLNRIWELDKRFLPEEVFFRVSESEPGEVITKEEMQGDFDFDIGPLTSTANKAQEDAIFFQAYAVLAGSPVVNQSPALRGELDKELLRKIRRGDLANLLPDFSQLKPPQSPDDENVRILQLEDVDPHPQDNHQQHIARHGVARDLIAKALDFSSKTGTEPTVDPRALAGFESHIAEHERLVSGGAPAGVPGGQQVNPNGGAGLALPSDQTGVPNDALNQLKGILNQGALNLG